MKVIHHQCRICKMPLELKQHEDCPDFTAETLAKLVVCNRCGDFRKVFWRIEANIKSICHKVWLQKSRSVPDPEVLKNCRNQLIELTRKLAAKTCDHYRIQFFWDDDFIAQLMEQPAKAERILGIYESSVARMNEPLSAQRERMRP